MTLSSSDYKTHAKRLRDALGAEGINLSHGKALDIVARQHGERDWNTLSARTGTASPVNDQPAPPFVVGDAVEGAFNGNAASGRVIGLAETIKPDLWRVTVKFSPPVDASTSQNFRAERTRVEMVVGADGRSRRLTGTETGVMALRRA
ncbi:glyoxalase superfamily protein [Mesorhizobium sp. CAU 1741]|uniref:glyoxalase superfamily protein n=1 Tax=Mesorhizobium sp. CAU 1741 TaxID=3140366 RepID=UPI00325AFBCE